MERLKLVMLTAVPEHLSVTKRHAKEISQHAHAFLIRTLQGSCVEILNHAKAVTAAGGLPMERPLAQLLLLAVVVFHPPRLLGSHVELHNPAKPTSAVELPSTVPLRARKISLGVRVFGIGILLDSIRKKISY